MALSFIAGGCDTIWNLDGSFEEARASGRVHSLLDEDNSTRRYFRLHLRQFDDTVGGVYETFDLDDFDSFTRVPEFMEQSMNRYYCARIDYGYVRDGMAYVSFTDREQRHWAMSLHLGDKILHGSLARTDSNRVELMGNLAYLMPEDAAYKHQSSSANMQIAFNSMGRMGDRPLDCLYYFKTRDIDFILPADLNLNELCEPSVEQCRNLRLGIVGTPVLHRLIEDDLPPFYEVISAYLDDCDIDENRIRSVKFRENPHVFTSGSSGLFVATAIIYHDLNGDSSWDKADEPVYAMLDRQSLVFYDSQPKTDIYSMSPDEMVYDMPILEISDMAAFPGWQIYHDMSDSFEDNAYIRVLKHLTPNPSRYLYLRAVNLNPADSTILPGCYVQSDTSDKQSCSQLMPILLQ